MKQNLFNVSALKKQIDDLQSQIIKDGELVKKQQESIVKQSVDFLMSIIDIYGSRFKAGNEKLNEQITH